MAERTCGAREPPRCRSFRQPRRGQRRVGEVLLALKGKLDGISMRVPTPNVSVVDLNVILEKKTTPEAVNAAFKAAADGPHKRIIE